MSWPAFVLAVLLLQQADPAADGRKALEEQRWDAAVAAFSKAVEAEPKDYSHHFHLALALSMLNRDAEAIAQYRRTLELKPELPPAQLNLAILLLRQKQPAEALPLLESVVRQKPRDARAQTFLGDALLATQDPSRAEAAYRAALEIDPNSAAGELGLGRSLAGQDKLADAAPHFEKTVALDASYRDVLLELAALYEQQKQLPEAIAIYQKFEDNPAARERLGELQLESGKSSDAIPNLEAAVAKSPTTANRYALAIAYMSEKQYAKAAPLLEQALAAEPGNLDLQWNYARAVRGQRNFPAAAREFYKVTQLKPDSAQAWGDLAGMLILSENYPEALAALDKVRALGAETAAHHYFRALVLDKQQIYKPALESYEKFLSMSEGKSPDEEFKARQRVKVIQKQLSKR